VIITNDVIHYYINLILPTDGWIRVTHKIKQKTNEENETRTLKNWHYLNTHALE